MGEWVGPTGFVARDTLRGPQLTIILSLRPPFLLPPPPKFAESENAERELGASGPSRGVVRDIISGQVRARALAKLPASVAGFTPWLLIRAEGCLEKTDNRACHTSGGKWNMPQTMEHLGEFQFSLKPCRCIRKTRKYAGT